MKWKILMIGAACQFSFMLHASEIADIVNAYQADVLAIKEFYPVHERTSYYQRESELYSQWLKKLNSTKFDNLSQDEKIDFLLLTNKVKADQTVLQHAFEAYRKVDSVVDFAPPLLSFIDRRLRGAQPNSKQLAESFSQAVNAIDKKVKKLKAEPFDNEQDAAKAVEIVHSLQEGLAQAYQFYYSYDPQFTWWMKKPYDKLDEKLTQYKRFLQNHIAGENSQDDGSGIVGKPIGKAGIEAQLRSAYIPYSAEELIDIAKEQFDWCKEQMILASQEMGYGDDWRAALEAVKNTYVPPGQQPQTINDLYHHSVKFVEQRDLVTLPLLAKETWQMIMMTSERQKVNPFFTGGRSISISYPTEHMAFDDKMMSMRGNNPNFSYPTVQHELLPGHNLQYFMSQRHKSYRQAFRNPFWTEGWALYWEIILWDKQFATTPEQKMGMLFWRIHRCARILFSLRYHLKEITPQQAINMLVDEVGHEFANAEAEVRRSFTTNYAPLYQLAYMIGGLQFYALRNEMLDKGWTEKQFHDRVMQENAMPIEVLRLLLQNRDFDADYTTQWRFSTSFQKAG